VLLITSEEESSSTKTKKDCSFTKRYNITTLVYFESFGSIHDAISAEKKIKSGSRAKKIKLIESINPLWKDLSI
jgi:putative endonuclease